MESQNRPNLTHNAETDAGQIGPRQATGAVVPEYDRCICGDICEDHCRACNHSGRDLEEPCIKDPDWEPDDEYLALREAPSDTRVIPPGGVTE